MSLPMKCGCQPVINDGVLTIERCETHQRKFCKHCGKEIQWVKTSIEDFWCHVDAYGFCNPEKFNWLTAVTWAEPREDEKDA